MHANCPLTAGISMRRFAMQLADGWTEMRALFDRSATRRRSGRVWGWGITLLAVVVPTTIALVPSVQTASAASPPVARADVARTDAGEPVSVGATSNDFDPDGELFGIASVATPAHGTVTNFGSGFNYQPDDGFSGVETITYTIEDSAGLTVDGVARVWVDTGVLGDQTPVLGEDYSFAYQGASASITTAELLSNDRDPQAQSLTVVAVSEPRHEGTLTGDLATPAFVFTPGNDPALIGSDPVLYYLVVDPEGHVAQSNVRIRILAADDPNRPPVAARRRRADDREHEHCSVFTLGNDFDPDGDGFNVVSVVTPATRHRRQLRLRLQLHTQPRLLRHRTVTYTIRDSHGLTLHRTATLWVDTGTLGPQSPRLTADYTFVYQGSVGVDHAAQLLSNDNDPQGQPLTVVAVSEPSTAHPQRRPRLRVHLHTQHRPRTDQHRPRPRLPRRRHRRPRHPRATSSSASSPPATPTDHQSRADDVARIDPDTTVQRVHARQRLRPRRRRLQCRRVVDPGHTAPSASTSASVQLHTQPRLLRHRTSPTASATATG